MSDACGCGHDEPAGDGEAEEREPEKLWEVSELRAAAVAGVLLVAALIVGWTGGPRAVELGLEIAALLVGAYTFVPSTLKRLAKGKIGVGTLMTIAAIGAVILGEVGEAAMLAFLFSISEGLEEYAVARTRRGLRETPCSRAAAIGKAGRLRLSGPEDRVDTTGECATSATPRAFSTAPSPSTGRPPSRVAAGSTVAGMGEGGRRGHDYESADRRGGDQRTRCGRHHGRDGRREAAHHATACCCAAFTKSGSSWGRIHSRLSGVGWFSAMTVCRSTTFVAPDVTCGRPA